MNILVCLKQIPDPEIPARDFRIADIGSANLVSDIFGENALETALQFGGKITVLSFGAPSAEDTLRKALAMKADAAALVINDTNPNPDPLAVAQVLAAAVRKLGGFDLILTGRESGDWGAGQTGSLLAEELGLPCVSFVDSIEGREGGVRLRRQTESGFEVIEASTPVVLTITNDEHNVPRIPKVRDVMAAHRQPLTTFTLADLGVDVSNRWYEVIEMSIPTKETACEFLTVEELAQRLLEVTAGA
ncbi:MAG: electron transfer flavoprotein subunit beta/FixA family protein [Acidobacteriota bacterium]